MKNRDGVALLAEGVDRNTAGLLHNTFPVGSPSSRRAWIEIRVNTTLTPSFIVALLAEGVDRNHLLYPVTCSWV